MVILVYIDNGTVLEQRPIMSVNYRILDPRERVQNMEFQ
jgi:hypothetical protein